MLLGGKTGMRTIIDPMESIREPQEDPH